MSESHWVEVVGLYCYPIKSCGQVILEASELNALGLAHDRQWMLVDEQGQFLSQRAHPKMALIAVDLDFTHGYLTVSADDMEPLTITVNDVSGQTEVTVWKDSLIADVAQKHINDWFSQYLNMPTRLVRFGDASQRLIEAEFNPDNKQVAFADGYPLLVTHVATLTQLNQQIAAQNHEAVTMQRFRPNIVVKSSLPAQDEFLWAALENQNFNIELAKPCGRCVMTNLDPKTAKKTGNNVLRTLAEKHRLNNKATFGINGWSQNSGTIRCGDRLEVRYQ